MKSAHLKKVEARAQRVQQCLLPLAVPRGEVADPQQRLRELILRVGGREVYPDGYALKGAVKDVVTFLETDISELIQAVRDAQRETWQARRDLAMRAGQRYQLVITSDAPIGIQHREVIPSPGQEEEQSSD